MKLGYKILLWIVQILIAYIIYKNWSELKQITPLMMIVGLMYSSLLIIVLGGINEN